MQTTYTEIRRITGNNKGYAEAAFEVTKQDCWWITDADAQDMVYMRTRNNDWVCIHGAYADEDVKQEFRTVRGNYVTMGGDAYGNYIAVVVE